MNKNDTLEQCISQLADADLGQLIMAVAEACCELSALVQQGELAGILGAAGSSNVQGEDQKKLDIIANDVFLEKLPPCGQLLAMASEEMEDIYPVNKPSPEAKYLITFDPLDGSSNIDVNGAVGTIFSVLTHAGGDVSSESFLQPGSQQICAGYCLYSSATMLILTTGDGAHGFTLDTSSGSFVLSHPHMQLPKTTTDYSINAAYQRHWFAPIKQYIDECVAGKDGVRGENFNMRWAGAMVGDVHRIMCKGGLFLYPSNKKLASEGKQGKLRLLYEANPMSFIVEQAGGAATTGEQRIMELQPDGLHQRVPVIMGSEVEVQRVTSYHDNSAV